MTTPDTKRAPGRISKRRIAQRDGLWADASGLVFHPVAGWAQMPRTVPMIASLIDDLSGKAKAGRLYLTLWSHEYGDGFVEVPDPALVALEAGYVTNRAERTFGERMATLRNLGFVRTASLGTREFGHVLLLDPHRVVLELRRASPDRVPERWWSAFVSRCAAVGIELFRTNRLTTTLLSSGWEVATTECDRRSDLARIYQVSWLDPAIAKRNFEPEGLAYASAEEAAQVHTALAAVLGWMLQHNRVLSDAAEVLGHLNNALRRRISIPPENGATDQEGT